MAVLQWSEIGLWVVHCGVCTVVCKQTLSRIDGPGLPQGEDVLLRTGNIQLIAIRVLEII